MQQEQKERILLQSYSQPVSNVLLEITDNCFERGIETKSDHDIQDSILLLQMVCMTKLNESVLELADKHAEKVTHN